MCVPYKKINFDRWNILKVLDKNEWQDAELIHICGGGKGAIILKNKILYTFGKSDEDLTFRYLHCAAPMALQDFKLENVQCIATGYGHAIILFDRGNVCSFGNNLHDQLGYITGPAMCGPQVLSLPKITAVSCGGYFTLALDCYNMVWFFGTMYYDDEEREKRNNSSKPICLAYPINIVKIACGSAFAVLLDRNGMVYTWGNNYDGNLGLGHTNDVWVPTRVESLRAHFITQITCASGCVLALTDKGELFQWGNVFDDVEQTIPKKVGTDFTFANIAASRRHSVFAAESTNGIIYHWGDDVGSSIPKRTDLENILDVFTNITMPGVHLDSNTKAISICDQVKIFLERIAQLYNTQTYSDVSLILSDGRIPAHKCILGTKSALFKRLLTQECSELNFCNNSPNVIRAYIKYLYTSDITEVANTNEIVELYEMSKKDSEVNLLKFCLEQWKHLINTENALTLYLVAKGSEAIELMKSCASVVVKNIDKFAFTPEFKKLEGEEIHTLLEHGLEK